jgi:hypothetical protein
LPRRLGDDPLSRARNGTAKATVAAKAIASAPLPPDSGGQLAMCQSGMQSESTGEVTPSPKSYNDVFFQRRVEGNDSMLARKPEQDTGKAPGTREISEISEIPEIRETVAVPRAEPDRSVTTIMDVVREVKEESAHPPAASQAPNQSEDQPEPVREKNGGFLKRLFGKFVK